jgi:hypothetical protein
VLHDHADEACVALGLAPEARNTAVEFLNVFIDQVYAQSPEGGTKKGADNL